jgi:hypothetical protein
MNHYIPVLWNGTAFKKSEKIYVKKFYEIDYMGQCNKTVLFLIYNK